jgi:transaldolase
MTPINRLTALGTSVWIDGLVPPAELERLAHDDAVTGLTSNPTIFRAAMRAPEEPTASSASRSRRRSPTTPTAPSRPPASCGRASGAPTP